MHVFLLAVTANVSRIPTTPGNQFFLHSVVAATVDLEYGEFRRSTVIKAFKENDPLKRNSTWNCGSVQSFI